MRMKFARVIHRNARDCMPIRSRVLRRNSRLWKRSCVADIVESDATVPDAIRRMRRAVGANALQVSKDCIDEDREKLDRACINRDDHLAWFCGFLRGRSGKIIARRIGKEYRVTSSERQNYSVTWPLQFGDADSSVDPLESASVDGKSIRRIPTLVEMIPAASETNERAIGSCLRVLVCPVT